MQLELETRFPDLQKVAAMPNIAEHLSDDDRKKLGNWVVSGYESDRMSRAEWEERTRASLELALQLVETKSFPWPDAANIKFPLLTIAALQYHSRAYPALIPGPDIVQCTVYGANPTPEQQARARRIKDHMSYQILEEDEGWEDNMDRVLITQPIVGCVFKKIYFDPVRGHNVSECVSAADFVVDYWTKNLDNCNRATHRYMFTQNDCRDREVRGLFLAYDHRYQNPLLRSDPLRESRNATQGTQPNVGFQDDGDIVEILEQHCYLDLDGDGYKEPYICYVNSATAQLLRVVARFFPDRIQRNQAGDIYHITAERYFVKYGLIPSPDGGFYDLGLGSLLSPLNESINTLINQLLDAGTMANLGGGFLGRGVRIRGGDYSFRPQEWKRVDSGPEDLRSAIYPLPIREPSGVLFQLLSLLIDYGERISGSTDLMTGITPGQNTPAQTSQLAAEQGMKVFSGIFKRTYRALKDEFRLLYNLNSLYLAEQQSVKVAGLGNVFGVSEEDYRSSAKFIRPASDPNMVSETQKLQRAMMLKQNAMSTPGYDLEQVEHRILDALGIRNPEQVYPGPKVIPPPTPPKVQIEQIRQQPKMAQLELERKVKLSKMQLEAAKVQAEITHLEADSVKLLSEAKGVESGHQIAALEAAIGAAKLRQEGLLSTIKIVQDSMKESSDAQAGSSNAGGVGGMAAAPGNAGVPPAPQGPGAGVPGQMG